MKLEEMSNEGVGIAAFLVQFEPELLTAVKDLSFEDLKDIYQSWEGQGIAGKEEKISLIKMMEPLTKSTAEKEFLEKIRKSLQGG